MGVGGEKKTTRAGKHGWVCQLVSRKGLTSAELSISLPIPLSLDLDVEG